MDPSLDTALTSAAERWTGATRNWSRVGAVYLNPDERPANTPEVTAKTG